MAEATLNQQALPAGDNRIVVQANQPKMNPIDAIAQSRTIRHVARLVGLAAAVAIGTVVVMWSAEPNFAPLYSNMSGQDSSQISEVLIANEIEFKLDSTSGSVLVDQAQLAKARLLLAAQGLPEGNNSGLEMLQKDQGLGTSQFIETARYNHALEAELVRSVESIRSVEKARIHLAIPKQSIFIRNRTKPSASVVVTLYPGRILNPGQVEAIVQMIASSIPSLQSTEVKVIDQFGRLLTEDADVGMSKTNRQYDYARQLESNLADSIVYLLQPIVGEGKVNAQVSAQLDFSAVESTREAYDPERSVIRSEQISEEENRSLSQALGIPGALSNQPPAAGTTEEGGAEEAANGDLPSNQNRSATRNFEVDRVISHTSNPVGSIQRLSVAVVIDNKSTTLEDGTIEKIAYSAEDITRFESLIKETIGFDVNRGDSVSVINTSFLEKQIPQVEALPLWQSLLEQTWLVNLIKQVLGALGVLIVYLMFGRPLLRSLKPPENESDGNKENQGQNGQNTAPMPVPHGQANEYYQAMNPGMNSAMNPGIPDLSEDPNNPAALMRRKDATYDQKVNMARTLVMDDPARVANVMKQWVGAENG